GQGSEEGVLDVGDDQLEHVAVSAPQGAGRAIGGVVELCGGAAHGPGKVGADGLTVEHPGDGGGRDAGASGNLDDGDHRNLSVGLLLVNSGTDAPGQARGPYDRRDAPSSFS